jgi:hypothetical protein
MKLSQLAAKPQLIKLTLEDADTVKEFGEAIEFWTWDRQPIETFMKLANAQSQDPASMINIVRTMILDEDAKEIVTSEAMLPTPVLLAAIQKIVEQLGKL